MAERATAESQLARILNLLPRASREGGASLTELAEALDTDTASVLKDLEEVYTRAYYHPAGSGEDVQILIETDRVAVWTAGEFRRPFRLSPRETLALALGLRVLAADAAPAARARRLELASTLEARVAAEPIGEHSGALAVSTARESRDGVRAAITEAARLKRRCRIAYLKPGASEPETRELDPYVLLLSDARWYVVGRCHRSAEPRVFRLDRMTSAEPLHDVFEVPDDFDPDAYMDAGRVYRGAGETEVEVRYSARIARWIEEQGPAERLDDGSVVVRYRVSDPAWLVKHVLQHAADAEVLGPPEMRTLVGEAARRALARG